MNDPEVTAQRLGSHLVSHLDEPTTSRLRASVYREVGTRRRRQRTAISAAFVVGAALAVAAARDQGTTPRPQVSQHLQASSEPFPGSKTLHLGPTAIATLLTEDVSMVAHIDGGESSTVELRRGDARFEVGASNGHELRVISGPVSSVLTSANVTFRRYADHVQLEVTSGRIDVLYENRPYSIGANESLRFDLAVAASAPSEGPSPAQTPPASTPMREEAPIKRDAQSPRNRRLRPREVASTNTGTAEPQRPDADTLLHLADESIARGEIRQALDHLDAAFLAASDPSTRAVSAFSTGRLYLESLNAPVEAAKAFRRARKASPSGPLAEDAWVREIECLLEAGDPATASARRSTYLELYPKGLRRRDVETLGASD